MNKKWCSLNSIAILIFILSGVLPFLIENSFVFLLFGAITTIAFILMVISPIKNILKQISQCKEINYTGFAELEMIVKSYNKIFHSAKKHKVKNTELSAKAITDELTGIYNYRGFCELINEIETNKYEKVTLLLCDLDNFKYINDTFGHKAGDMILQIVAGLFNDVFDHYGSVFRYGGEEFATIILDDDQSFIKTLAEKFRKKVEECEVFFETDYNLRVTVSIGIASIPYHSKHLNDLFNFADQALYFAKKNGKNKIISFEEIHSIDIIKC